MITNDIQELLDGALGDERMSELLHTLSVSPEKRAAFRQHMALRGTMERDRAASALAPSEDAAIWGSIASAIQAPAAAGISGGAAVASRIPSWFMRSAAVVVVGVAGYLLGSNETTNIFRSGDSAPTVAVNAPAPAGNVRTAPASTSAAAPSESDAASVPSTSVPTPAAAATRSGSTQPVSPRLASSFQSGGTVRPSATARRHAPNQNPLVAEQSINDQPINNQAIASNDVTHQGGSDRNTPPVSPAMESSVAAITPVQMMDNRSMALSASAQTTEEMAAQKNRAIESKPLPLVPIMPLAMKHRNASTIAPEAAPFYANGWEVAFGERVGMITPLPTKIVDPDPEYSNRSLDLSYRMLDGRVGIGGRLTYGTFSTVNFEASQENTLSDEINYFDRKLTAKKGLAYEGFVNYRLPLWGPLAIGAEASFTGSPTYQKAGGDLFLLWFVSDHIGIQAGGGYGQYWYNLNDEYERISSIEGNAIRKEGSSGRDGNSYQGTMLQGRYGLFYRF